MKNKFNYCLLFFCFVYFRAYATHIIGGEIYYEKLSGNNYKINLNLYRDCLNGVPSFDDPALITIFDSNGNIVLTKQLQLFNDTSVSLINYTPNCVETPTNICVRKGIYIDTVSLSPIIGGYTIVYQRCCRTTTLLNIDNTINTGATYSIDIPGSDIVSVNSSPKFSNLSPFYFCNNEPNIVDHSAMDIDGDSLVYFLTNPFDGLDACCPMIGSPPSTPNIYCPSPPASCPTVNIAPPYLSVVYSSGYNSGYPISSSPAIAINSTSGIITLTPNLQGDFAIGIGVNEYRNQVLIGTYYRDFHTKVLNCSVCTNVNEFSNIELSVFPNPVTQIITVKFQNNMNEGYYVLTDVTGKIILKDLVKSNSLSVDIKDLAKGIYFFRIFFNEKTGSIVKKIVVE